MSFLFRRTPLCCAGVQSASFEVIWTGAKAALSRSNCEERNVKKKRKQRQLSADGVHQ
jgi:hypothetical protein